MTTSNGRPTSNLVHGADRVNPAKRGVETPMQRVVTRRQDVVSSVPARRGDRSRRRLYGTRKLCRTMKTFNSLNFSFLLAFTSLWLCIV